MNKRELIVKFTRDIDILHRLSTERIYCLINNIHYTAEISRGEQSYIPRSRSKDYQRWLHKKKTAYLEKRDKQLLCFDLWLAQDCLEDLTIPVKRLSLIQEERASARKPLLPKFRGFVSTLQRTFTKLLTTNLSRRKDK